MERKNKKIYYKKLLTPVFLVALAGILISVFAPKQVQAFVGEKDVLLVINWLVYYIMVFLGWLFTFFIWILRTVLNINKFTTTDTVIIGWTIVRNLCNMFFILALLIISFATILRMENYGMKRMLPKLIIMAVLINFSRMICGLLIDFSQVIMLFFASAFSNTGLNNLADLLGMKDLLTMTSKVAATNMEINGLTLFAAIMTGAFAIIVAMVVILVMVVVLLFRVIMLWVLTILSPFAFMAYAFPGGQKYTSQWWGEFVKQLIIGPMLAFWLWLTISTAKATTKNLFDPSKLKDIESFSSKIPTDFFSAEVFMLYLTSIALLVGGLIMTQKFGGVAGAAAGRGLGAVKGAAARYTGYRYARDRVGAFQAQRTAARQAKIGDRAGKDFATFTALKRAPRTGLAMAGATVEATKVGAGINKLAAKGNLVQKWRNRQATKKSEWNKHEANMQKALETGEGFAGSGKLRDYYYKTDGNKVSVSKMGEEGTILSATKGQMARKSIGAATMAPATALKKKYQQQAFESASSQMSQMSLAQQRQFALSNSANDMQKQAVAMNVAKAGAFRDDDDLKALQKTLKGNTAAQKEFNKEAAKKGFGQWAYGKDEFDSKVDSGEIKLKDTNISVIADPESFKEFAERAGDKLEDTLSDIQKRSPKASTGVKKALTSQVESYGGYREATSGMSSKEQAKVRQENRVRAAYVGAVGDYKKGFANDAAAQQQFISKANVKKIDTIVKYNKNDSRKLDEIVSNLSKSQVDSFSKANPGAVSDDIRQRWLASNQDKNSQAGFLG